MEQQVKPAWQSKTMVLNAIMGLAAAAALFLPQAAAVKGFLEANAATVALVWSVLGMGLRAITKDKIQLGE